MKKALHFFFKKLRLSNPWNFKAPLLITIPYLIFLLGNYNGDASFQSILASVSIIVGVAGVGYLTNDLGDREKDLIIQKQNATSDLSNSKLFLLFALFFSLAIGPWFYLPFNKTSLLMLGIQFFLFYSYAFKPFRLKERGIFGVIADAMYAHVVPAMLAAFTFYLVVKKTAINYTSFMLLLAVWQFLLGIRNICLHQLKDFHNDQISQTRTFAVQVGVSSLSSFVKKIILPLEIISFVLFIVFISLNFAGLALLVVLYCIYKLFAERKMISNFGYRDFSNKILDDLYTQWLPFAVLVLLCYSSLNFLPLLLLHFVLFRSELKTRLLYSFKLL